MFAFVLSVGLLSGPVEVPEPPWLLQRTLTAVSALPIPRDAKGWVMYQLVQPGMTQQQVRTACAGFARGGLATWWIGGMPSTDIYTGYGVSIDYTFPEKTVTAVRWIKSGPNGARAEKRLPEPWQGK